MAAQGGDASAFFQGSKQGEFDFMLPQAVKVFLRDFYASVKNRDVQGECCMGGLLGLLRQRG